MAPEMSGVPASNLCGAFAVFGGGIDRAERIGNVRHRQQLHVAGEELVEPAGIEQTAVTVDREESELRAGALGQELPGHDVAVVLHLGEQDFAAARFLARGRVVEIDERMTVDLLVENREILAPCFPINCLSRLHPHKFLATA